LASGIPIINNRTLLINANFRLNMIGAQVI
jgi:hypothetical protein